MLLSISKRIKLLTTLSIVFSVMGIVPAHAADAPAKSIFSNTLAISLIGLMAILLIIIVVLANVLLGAAQFRLKQTKKDGVAKTTITTLLLLFSGNLLFAQSDEAAEAVAIAPAGIGGMPSYVFYIMISVIFLELLVILVLLINVKMLLKAELVTKTAEGVEVVKKPTVTWWSKVNRFKPVEQEADIDLGHDYDGIRELDNRLPPWWLYGFYISIIFAAVYLWRFHVSHTGPSSAEEYNRAVADAEIEIKAYLAKKGEAVDENTVTLLTSPDDIAAGKIIYTKSCISCHKESGAGDVGPNLTDDYWMHGGDIKSIFKTIRYGVNAMPQWQNAYSNKQIAQVASYVKSLHGTNPPGAKAPQGELYKEDAGTGTTTVSDSTSTDSGK